uniref:Uncharacterized protein n=1 Tax=Triticum urartu TaxID=4572 RepID=A0A8R7PX59_TRIUA
MRFQSLLYSLCGGVPRKGGGSIAVTAPTHPSF